MILLPHRRFDPAGIPPWILGATVLSCRADLLEVTGSGASRWLDQSGHVNHPIQTDDAKRMLVDPVAINGYPALDGDATRYFDFQSAEISALTAAEVFIVGRLRTDPPGLTAETGLWDFGSAGDLTHFPFTDGTIYDDFGTTARKTTVDPGPSLTSTFMYNVISTASEWTSRLNNTQIFTTATNTVGWGVDLRIGASGAGSAKIDGWIAEIHIFPAKVSNGQRDDMHTYLQGRYAY